MCGCHRRHRQPGAALDRHGHQHHLSCPPLSGNAYENGAAPAAGRCSPCRQGFRREARYLGVAVVVVAATVDNCHIPRNGNGEEEAFGNAGGATAVVMVVVMVVGW